MELTTDGLAVDDQRHARGTLPQGESPLIPTE